MENEESGEWSPERFWQEKKRNVENKNIFPN